MKKMRKLLSLVLVLVMVLGLSTVAFAADKTITITSSESGAAVTGHTYEVYQIFTGDVAVLDSEEVLSNVAYGANYTSTNKVDDELAAIKEMTGAAAAEYLDGKKSGDPVATLNAENNWSVSVPTGYYLIVDVTEDLPENETSSAFILELVGDTTIKSKHTSGPNVEKKIDDKNDSNTSEDEIIWHDSADHDIGDMIDFKISATIPSAFQLFVDNEVPYPFTFHDTEETGLTFQPDSVKVYVVNGVEKTQITTGFELDTDPADKHTFDVVFDDLTAIEGVVVGSEIVVEYKSQLNENAIIGNLGNVNKVFGEFRNYFDTDEPSFTPEDAVIAFTYKIVVNKVDQDLEPLSGAEFNLEKFVANAEGAEEYEGVKGGWVAIDTVEAEPETTFTFKGLDDGEYRLTETVTPAGYNTIDPVYFTVTADHDVEWATQAREDVLNTLTGDVVTGELEFTEDVTVGSLSTDVVNNQGVELPETGGIGTTIFYIVGGILVLGAVVLLVTKKRMSAEA